MAHAVRKAAHALAEEGELLNVHSELKDLSHAVDNRIRIHERVSGHEGCGMRHAAAPSLAAGGRGRGKGGQRRGRA